jgi:hypothetical protein
MTDDGDGISVSMPFYPFYFSVEPPPATVSFPASPETIAAIEAAIADAEKFGGTPDFVIHDGVTYWLNGTKGSDE